MKILDKMKAAGDKTKGAFIKAGDKIVETSKEIKVINDCLNINRIQTL